MDTMDDRIATNLFEKFTDQKLFTPIMTDTQAEAIYSDEQETQPVNLDGLPDSFDDKSAARLMQRARKYGISSGVNPTGSFQGNIGNQRKPQRLPVSGRISQEYGVGVNYEKSGKHGGVDIAIPIGTPIPDEGGEVISAGPSGGFGNSVMVRGQDGVIRRYSHLSSIDVKVGQKIPSGYVVGKSGNTGYSTGPHLDYREYTP